jgi:hypothetical protein
MKRRKNGSEVTTSMVHANSATGPGQLVGLDTVFHNVILQ